MSKGFCTACQTTSVVWWYKIKYETNVGCKNESDENIFQKDYHENLLKCFQRSRTQFDIAIFSVP